MAVRAAATAFRQIRPMRSLTLGCCPLSQQCLLVAPSCPLSAFLPGLTHPPPGQTTETGRQSPSAPTSGGGDSEAGSASSRQVSGWTGSNPRDRRIPTGPPPPTRSLLPPGGPFRAETESTATLSSNGSRGVARLPSGTLGDTRRVRRLRSLNADTLDDPPPPHHPCPPDRPLSDLHRPLVRPPKLECPALPGMQRGAVRVSRPPVPGTRSEKS